MTSRTKITISAAILLLIAGLAILGLKKPSAAGGQSSPPGTRGSSSAAMDRSQPAGDLPVHTAKAAKDDAADAGLIQKYGQSRVTLSRHVALGTLDFIGEFNSMKEMAAEKRLGASMDSEPIAYLGNHTAELNLDREQKTKIAEILLDHQKRNYREMQVVADAARKDPTALMQRYLLMDALKSGRISAEDFRSQQIQLDPRLNAFVVTMSPDKLNQDDVLTDDGFVRAIEPLLKPEQIDTLHAARAGQQADAAKPDTEPAEARDLEAAETKIGGYRKMAESMKKMMEAQEEISKGSQLGH